MQNLYLVIFAASAGAGLALQAAINTQLRAAANSALWASLLSATLTVVLLGGAVLFAREPLDTARFGGYPWWIWTGGIMGAVYVFAIVFVTRQLGVALVFAAIVSGQLAAGMLIDHFGWFRVAVTPLSPTRIVGALLLVAGMILIRWR